MRWIFICLICVSYNVYAQKSNILTHTIFAEALGSGGLYSVNYDRILFVSDKSIYSVRVGAALVYHEVDVNKKGIECTFPLTLSRWSAKNKNHHFETSFGTTAFWGYYGDGFKVNRGVFWGLNGFVGYRYQKPQGGIMVRAGWAPIYDIYEDRLIPYWVGAGIGYTF